MKQILLIGNGLNNASSNAKDISWTNSLLEMMDENQRKMFTFPDGMDKIVSDISPLFIYDIISGFGENSDAAIKKFSEYKNNDPLIEKFMDLYDVVLTTNFTGELELGKYGKWKNKYFKERLYSIFRSRESKDGKLIWYIHGNVNRSESVNLSFSQYTRQLAKIQSYMDGTLDSPCVKGLASMSARRKNGDLNSENPVSWVDYFFTPETKINIVGFSLAYSELDLWWLLEKRAKEIKSDENNEICFYMKKSASEEDERKKYILEQFKVSVKEIYSDDYDKEYFEKVLEDIKKTER